MLTGLPLLTADEHEFRTVIDGDPPEDEPGWVLINVGAAGDGAGNVYIVDHWARRKDGRPMVKPDTWHTDMLALEGQLRVARETIAALRGELQCERTKGTCP
jgi:hypothetical protein